MTGEHAVLWLIVGDGYMGPLHGLKPTGLYASPATHWNEYMNSQGLRKCRGTPAENGNKSCESPAGI